MKKNRSGKFLATDERKLSSGFAVFFKMNSVSIVKTMINAISVNSIGDSLNVGENKFDSDGLYLKLKTTKDAIKTSTAYRTIVRGNFWFRIEHHSASIGFTRALMIAIANANAPKPAAKPSQPFRVKPSTR